MVHTLELLFLYGSHFYRVAVIFKGHARSKVEAHVIHAMASTSETTRARKKAISLDADASTSDLLNSSSSEESDNDVVTSDFSSDEEISSDQPGTSAVSRGYVWFSPSVLFVVFWSWLTCSVCVPHIVIIISSVSTSFGRDVLPPAQRRVDFRPQRDPGIDLGMTLRSSAQFIAREVLEL